jgi:very-short-patch-repair endonuclease
MWRKLWFNAPEMKFRRQELRKNATKAEKILWNRLKQSQLGAKFIRQYSVGNWVVDFYCPAVRLALEIDGKLHLKKKIADEYRDKYLSEMGIKVMRIRNEEVMNEIEVVLNKIIKNITYLCTPT